MVETLRVGDRVQFLGSKTREEVAELLAAAHLLLAPSVTAADGDQEGIPNTLKEAMAAGLPVVSTLHSGIPELVEDGRSGFLVPERDSEALADRVGWLVDRPDSWPDMGRAGRSRVEAEYDIAKLSIRLVELYQSVLEG
jgi:colanic acid/amylovoran biosynthesis glycosyltransferase